MGWEIKTWIQKTKSSFIETVNSLHEQIKSNGPGEISSDKGSDKGSDPSLTERAKKWLKDKASGLWEKAKSTIIDKGISLLKNRLTKWILKGFELESYIEIKLAEWFVDWLGDKAGDKLKEWLVKGKRGPNVQKPCNPVSTLLDLPDPVQGCKTNVRDLATIQTRIGPRFRNPLRLSRRVPGRSLIRAHPKHNLLY